MNLTIKHKISEKQSFLKKASQLKFLTGMVSKQIKDCYEPKTTMKTLPIQNMAQNKTLIIKKLKAHKNKCSTETTASSSLSTRYQSAEKCKKQLIENPEQHLELKEHLEKMNRKSCHYGIKWRNPISNISKVMRVMVGEWLMQLSLELQIPKQSIYNAMYYTDKYVGLTNVQKKHYQSIGLCALFLASKLQLSRHQNIDTFVQAMDGAIKKEQLIALERNIVMKLKFKLNPPTLYQYMVLLVSLWNHLWQKSSSKHNCIIKDSEAFKDIFWILDGVHLENQYKQFHNKEKVCSTILYLALKKNKAKTSIMRRKIFSDLQSLRNQGEFEKMFEQFLLRIGQVDHKLTDLQQCIKCYKKWVKYQRVQGAEQEISELKRIILKN